MPKLKKKLTLCFDYDGVLADSLEVVAKIHGELVRRFEKVATAEITADFLKENWRGNWQGLYTNFYGFSAGELSQTMPVYRTLAREEFSTVKLFKGMDALVRKLSRSHNLLILSANYSDIIYPTLERAGIADCFTAIFGQDDMPGIEKSDARFYLIPLDELNFEKEDTVMIGDSVADILGAKKAGIPVIACSWGWQLRDWLVDAKPDYLADSPKELLSIIQGI